MTVSHRRGEGIVTGKTNFATVFVGGHPPCRARQELQGGLQAQRTGVVLAREAIKLRPARIGETQGPAAVRAAGTAALPRPSDENLAERTGW